MPLSHASSLLTEFAPTGILRVALNHGNPILAGRTPRGEPAGISISIACALAQHLGLDLRFVEYDRAADVVSAAEQDKWDLCFLAFDPLRARMIAFAPPYLQIKGSYLAGPATTATGAEELVASGVPIGAVEGSAYTLTLQRRPGSEHLVIFRNFQSLARALDDGGVAAIAGIDTVMRAEADKRPGTRVLDPPFMEIRQAIGVPQGRPAATAELAAWLSKQLRNGSIAEILEEHGVGRECLVT
ncbi:transporter substrate-binding domain-containing protein [Roseibium sp. MMSF_3544]|uniref:transporter substrate-binding domain-containing protein n=1 Tax=unclassified Roseibium TaxID=2629323 RepID=UPI00273ECBF5|nr:transporter substrate-binding domain-containing protein [Roseibium sp. MMSF_3544]